LTILSMGLFSMFCLKPVFQV